METPVSLLERLRQPHEQTAWGRFVELYSPLLYGWAQRLGLQDQDARDLVQDVFTVLVQKLPEFRYDPQKSFRAWLHTLVRNKWRDRLRRQAVLPVVQAAADFADREAPDNLEAIEEAEYRTYLVQRTLELLQSEFQPTTWQAFQEYAVRGRPVPEVAQELGITANAVHLARGRVLRRVREELDGLLD
jgi:RNA polymerase sigma-70 factor (ECF subfamily)